MATTLRPTGIRLNRAAEHSGERQMQGGEGQTDCYTEAKTKRDIRQKGQNRAIDFSLNSCRHDRLRSVFFG